ADRANRRSQQLRVCLTAMIADYQRRIAAAEQSVANLDATLAAIDQAHQQRQVHIASLQTHIRAGDNSDEQLKLRRAVRALMNQDVREQAQQQALLQNRDRLPALVKHTRERLSALLAYYQNAEKNSGAVVTDTLRETLQALASDFSDVAGEAALGKAQLQEEFAD